MPECMWTDGFSNVISIGQVLDNQEDHLARKASATAVEEYSIGVFGLGCDVQSCAFDVLEQDFQAAVADGNKPFLAALAYNAQEAVFAIDIADLQSDEFRNTQSAAVHHFNHGLVAVASGLAEVDAVDHLLDFFVGKNLGEMSSEGGRGDEQGGVFVGQFLLR